MVPRDVVNDIPRSLCIYLADRIAIIHLEILRLWTTVKAQKCKDLVLRVATLAILILFEKRSESNSSWRNENSTTEDVSR